MRGGAGTVQFFWQKIARAKIGQAKYSGNDLKDRSSEIRNSEPRIKLTNKITSTMKDVSTGQHKK